MKQSEIEFSFSMHLHKVVADKFPNLPGKEQEKIAEMCLKLVKQQRRICRDQAPSFLDGATRRRTSNVAFPTLPCPKGRPPYSYQTLAANRSRLKSSGGLIGLKDLKDIAKRS